MCAGGRRDLAERIGRAVNDPRIYEDQVVTFRRLQ
jgi:hypothetical protein